MAIRQLVFALCCALATAAAPGNFKAHVSDRHGDSVTVNLTWDGVQRNSFEEPYYTISYNTNGDDEQSTAGSTKETNMTVLRMEYWTRYNFTLSTISWGVREEDVFAAVATGPGNPHPAKDVKVSPNITEAVVMWSEAEIMPRTPDTYNVTYCLRGTTNCKTSLVFRNFDNDPNMKTTVRNLVPNASYTLTVRSVIQFEGKIYASSAEDVSFKTKPSASTNFKAALGDSHGDTIDINLTWDSITCNWLDHPYYTVTYTENGGEIKFGGSSKEPMMSLHKMEYWTRYNFTLSTKCREQQEDVFTGIATGPGSPHPVEDVKVSAGITKAEVVWTEAASRPRIPDLYKVVFCYKNTTECKATKAYRNYDDSSTMRTTIYNLDPSTGYTVTVTAIIEFEGETYSSSAEDIGFNTKAMVPTHFKAVIGHGHGDSVDIDLTWDTVNCNSWNDPSYTITFTENEGNERSVGSTKETKITLHKMEYWTNYNFTLSTRCWTRRQGVVFAGIRTGPGNPHAVSDLKVTPNITEAEVVWTEAHKMPRLPDMYNVTYCLRGSDECEERFVYRNFVDDPSIITTIYNLEPSTIYTMSVTALIQMEGKIYASSAQQISFNTTGIDVGPVEDLVARDITSHTALLSWKAPTTASLPITDYSISDKMDNFINKTSQTSIIISGMTPYTNQTFIIGAHVKLHDKTFDGEGTPVSFTTEVGAPGPVQNISFVQKGRSTTFILTWSKPEVTNGPVDFYNVTVTDDDNEVINKTTDFGGKYYIANLPGKNGATYTAQLVATNVNSKGELCYGEATKKEATFHGIDAPENAKVLNRTSSEIFVEITPPKGMTDEVMIFKLEALPVNRTAFVKDGLIGVIDSLPAYTNLTIRVRGCYEEQLCGESFEFSAITNVGAPDEVTDLTATAVNLTVPLFTWKAPLNANGPLDGYRVTLKDLTKSRDIPTVAVLPHNQTSFSVPMDEEYETYNFTVSAFNIDQDNATDMISGTESVITLTTSGQKAPKPVDVKQLNMTGTSAFLTWTAPTDARFTVRFYHVIVKRQALCGGNFTENTHFELNNLPPYENTTVYVSSCVNKTLSGCGRPFNCTVRTDASNPSEPTALKFKEITTESMLLEWSPPKEKNGPLEGYKLCSSEKVDDKDCHWIHMSSKTASHNLTMLKANTKYTVFLKAYNINSKGESVHSKPAIGSQLTAGASGFPLWAIILIVTLLAACVAGSGVVYYKKRRVSASDDEDILVGD